MRKILFLMQSKKKTADAVDMKRVEMSVDWNNNEQDLETDNNDSE